MIRIDQEQFYSVSDVARMLKFHPKTIYGWIAEEKLKVIRSNGSTGRIRIRETEYNRFVTEELTAK